MIARGVSRILVGNLMWLMVSVQAAGGEKPPAERLGNRSASLSALFSFQQAKALGDTLPVDRTVHWRVYTPEKPEPAGVLVFISPTPWGTPHTGWLEVLEQRNLIWVAADDFGNDQPTAQRILAAIMGLTDIRQNFDIDSSRIYAAGVSGGGRAASIMITRFPRLFTGAIYMVGVDFWEPQQRSHIEQIAQNRYVFLTGHDDFNRRETKSVYRKYRTAGVAKTLLIDAPELDHDYPSAALLAQALGYLDTGSPD